MNKAELLVWVDCEMTGLNIDIDELVEVAIVVTDSELKPISAGFNVVIKPSETAFEQMNDFVKNMHQSSGLLTELADGITLAAAQQQIMTYLTKIVTQAKAAPLAGNSIGTDRMFIAKFLPELDEYLHYRNVDVSSIKELAKRWYPEVYKAAPAKNGNHRAMADIIESIRELSYYRLALFPKADLGKDVLSEHRSWAEQTYNQYL